MTVSKSFPAKIYQILQNESHQIVQWNESGLSFRIVDNGRFAREIVPKYFRRKPALWFNFERTLPSPLHVSQITRCHLFSDSWICTDSEGSAVGFIRDLTFILYSSGVSGRQ
jgi:hypothetical protein